MLVDVGTTWFLTEIGVGTWILTEFGVDIWVLTEVGTLDMTEVWVGTRVLS